MKMKTTLFAAAFTALLGAAVLTATAADKPADDKKAPATTQASKPAVNKFCAVEGGDHTVDPDFFVMYKGYKIGFCCKDCIKEFESAPDEYLDKMKARNDFPKK